MPRPLIVRDADAEARPWERALAEARVLVLDEETPVAEIRAALSGASCAIFDGTGPDPVGPVRRVHALDPALQAVAVVPAGQRRRIERAMAFSPGLGEVWFTTPRQVDSALVQRAADATLRRRTSPSAQDLAGIDLQLARRAFLSDAFLAALLEAIPDPVVSIDEAGRILSWSPAASRVLGPSRGEALGRPIGEMIEPEDPEAFTEILAARDEPRSAELVLRDGSAGHQIAAVTVLPLEAGGDRIRVVILHDVTDARRAQRERETQADELKLQAEELRTQSRQLQDTHLELELANEDLQRAISELTERTREAERQREMAEEARARLEAVLRQLPSGVLLAEAPSGRLVLGNPQVEAIWRRPFLEATDISAYDEYPGFHPDGRRYRPEEWPLARSIAQGETVMGEEIAILRGDGSRGVIAASSAPILDREGRRVAAVAIFDDVTERREREDEQVFLVEAGRVLSDSLDYHETLRSAARLAVPRIADWCVVDLLEDGEIQRLAAAHPDPDKEALAHEMGRRYPPDPDATVGVGAVLRTGQAQLYTEVTDENLRAAAQDDEHFRILRELGLRSGMIVPISGRGRTLGAITFVSAESGRRFTDADLGAAEQFAGRAGAAIDNARLYREAQRAREAAEHAREAAESARHEAEAANRAKSEFLAAMSHEIRTPINAIIGYTDLVAMGLSGPVTDAQMGHFERIRASSQHLMTLIEDILDLSKVEAGRLEVAREPAGAAAVVAAALSLVGPQAREKQIGIEDACGEAAGAPYVGDEDRVRQILLNLLTNAVKFTEPGGSIRVSCGSTEEVELGVEIDGAGPWTYIRVRDTGIGIEPEDLERIFRPFQQVEAGHTRTQGGTGLGLAISRQLARLMGGDLTATSEPGVGSTFTLWLPQEVAEWPRFEDVVLTEAPELSVGGVGRLGEVLREELAAIVEAYAGRLVEDPLIPDSEHLSRWELEDHAASFLTDVAQVLIVLEESGSRGADLLRDGAEIQAVIARLHGLQRARLGWSEEALERDFEILREESEAALQRRQSDTEEHSEAVGVLRRFIGQAERISLLSLRGASVEAT